MCGLNLPHSKSTMTTRLQMTTTRMNRIHTNWIMSLLLNLCCTRLLMGHTQPTIHPHCSSTQPKDKCCMQPTILCRRSQHSLRSLPYLQHQKSPNSILTMRQTVRHFSLCAYRFTTKIRKCSTLPYYHTWYMSTTTKSLTHSCRKTTKPSPNL